MHRETYLALRAAIQDQLGCQENPRLQHFCKTRGCICDVNAKNLTSQIQHIREAALAVDRLEAIVTSLNPTEIN